MPYKDLSVRRERDRERFHRRTAERGAAGLCPRCGKRPPEPGRSVCAPCGEKSRRAERARDARLRAAGKPRRDRSKARPCERARSRRQAAERIARNLCARCGKVPPEPDRRMCEPCAVKRRASERVRYAAGKAAGKLYGGRDPEARRRTARTGSRKRNERRIARGLCMRCGRRPPAEGKTNCAPCRDACRTARRKLYEARCAAGLCVTCGGPTSDGGSRCAPCAVREAGRRSPERKNAAARRRYAERRARGRCTDCNAPSQGAARCAPCASRSLARSNYYRGMPLWDSVYTVIECVTGACLGTFSSEADVALCLAFGKLTRDQVEIIIDQSPMASFAAWE